MAVMSANSMLGAAMLGLLCLAASAMAQEGDWEAPMRQRLNAMAENLVRTLKPWQVPDRALRVEEYGAVADGQTLNTSAVQRAVDLCSEQGGGVVLFAKGDYVIGTVELKPGVMLQVDKGARILGSTDLADYPERIEAFKSINSESHKFRLSLFYAEKAKRVGIRGKGIIDFRGTKANFPGPQTTGPIVGRPFGIRMIECSDVVLQDITLKDAAAWMQNYIACDNLIFERITVSNHANVNNDGLDPDGCRNVIIRDCVINAEDDALCFKGGSGRATENVLVENCTIYSTCNAFKYGTDTQGDFRNVLARNLVLGGVPPGASRSGRSMQASTGITLAAVDGGRVEDILITGVRIDYARCPIFLRVGNRARAIPKAPKPPIGAVQRVVIEDIRGTNNLRQGSLITGISGGPVEDVVIRNMQLGMEGGGEADLLTQEVGESINGYPDAHQFKPKGLPAYGFWFRHARRVELTDVAVTPAKPDARPPFASGIGTANITVNGTELGQGAIVRERENDTSP